MFEHALSQTPADHAKAIYLQYALLEEQHGLAKHAMEVCVRGGRWMLYGASKTVLLLVHNPHTPHPLFVCRCTPERCGWCPRRSAWRCTTCTSPRRQSFSALERCVRLRASAGVWVEGGGEGRGGGGGGGSEGAHDEDGKFSSSSVLDFMGSLLLHPSHTTSVA